MAEITLTAAFSTVPAPDQEAIKRVLSETIEQLSQEDRSFTRAKVVFTESDERCVFRVAEGAQPPKAGSLLFCRHLAFRPGERVLEIGTGIGLAAVLAARAGCHVVATDVVPAAVECARQNALLNGLGDRVDTRLGDCYEPVRGLAFDLVCTSPPQMPTPPGRERDDPVAAADNGGPDGWALLDRVIEGADRHLSPGGRLIFTMFAFLGLKGARARL